MQENLELVRRMTDAFLAGDGPAALALMHPDVEFEANARPDAGVWRGPDGVRRAIAEWIGTWDDYSLEIRDYVEIPDGRVLVLWTERGRGKGSGIPIEHDGGYVVTLRERRDRAYPHVQRRGGGPGVGRALIGLRTCVMRPGRLELPRSKRTTRPSTLRVYQFRHRRVREPSIEPGPGLPVRGDPPNTRVRITQ